MCAWIFSTFVLVILLRNGIAKQKNVSKIIGFEKAQKSPLNDESLIECVVDLTQITIIFQPTILILESEIDDNDDVFFNKMIERFVKNDVPITIQDKDNHEVNQTLDVYDGNVIVIVHFENFDDLSSFKLDDVDKRVKYLVIISEETEDYIQKLKTYGQVFTGRYITFIIPDSAAEEHNVITFLPIIDEISCQLVDKTEPKLINICINGSLETDFVFPEGLRLNFKKCPLRVGMAKMYPFSKIENAYKLKNYDFIPKIEGSDVEIIKIIANYFNASIVWHYLRRDEQNPYSSTEYLKFIFNGSVNVSAGGLYRIYGDRVSYSGIYTMQAVIWIYAAHRAGRSLYNLMHKLNGMYLFYIFYLLYSFVSYCFRKYDREKFSLRNIILYSWGALVGAASLPEPKSLKHKILDVFYLVLTIFLSSFINIQLVSFLTVDGPATSFKTNDDVINSGRIPYLNQKNKDFIQESKYLAFSNTSKSCGDFYDCSYKVLHNDGLTVILDEYFLPLQAFTAVNHEAKVLRATQKIVTVYHEMLLSKDSFIVARFQKVLARLFEAGICKQLFNEAVGITVVAKAHSANEIALGNSYSCESGCAITLSQVAGVFYFWVFGCCLAMGAFLLERLYKRQKNLHGTTT